MSTQNTDMQEILGKLIPYYEHHIWWLRQMNEPIHLILKYLIQFHLDMGVCQTADDAFGEHIYGLEWVTAQNEVDGIFWGDVPGWERTQENVIAALQLRVDIMKRLLAEAKSDSQT